MQGIQITQENKPSSVQQNQVMCGEVAAEAFFPSNLDWALHKHGVRQFVATLSQLQRDRVSEIFYLMDKTVIRWASDNLSGERAQTLIERLSRTQATDDPDVNEYWCTQKPYFDFRRIGAREVSTQIAIIKGLVQLSDKALADVINHGQANLWPLACFGRSSSHVFDWADRLSDEMANHLYDRMAHEHIWTSHTLLDVIAVLTEWDEELQNRSHLWAEWQIMYTRVNGGLAFRLAVRDCTDAELLMEYRLMAKAALKDKESVRAFELCHSMQSTADDALTWFIERLRTHAVNREVLQPRWIRDYVEGIGQKYGFTLIWPSREVG